jgi:excisionase family DNA binding protein
VRQRPLPFTLPGVNDPNKQNNPPPRSYSTAYVAERLGVSIPTVQRWVDAGHINAWKTPGGHRRIAADSADALIASQQRQSNGAAEGSGTTVVVVDDNPDDRDLLAAIVHEALPRAALRSYENGFQALVAIGREPPEIVITDIVMPHMDGLEMLRQLATEAAVRPRLIVAVSANADRDGAPLVVLPAGVHFVPKPLRPEALIALLRGATAPA